MAYTGKDYFLQVKLSDNTNSKVRDAEIDALMQTKGAILTSNGTSNGLANFTSVTPGATNQILAMGSAGLPVWTSASAAAGVNDADLNIKLNDANATKLFSANSNTAATLSFASGSANGSIAINGTNVSVTGLKSAAFAETTAFDAAGDAAAAEQRAKTYTDTEIGKLGNLMRVIGVGATLPESGTKQGDVYIINEGTNAGKEYVWTGEDWEELGKATEVDLSGYVAKSEVIPGITTGISLGTIGGTTIYMPSATSLSSTLGLKALAFKDNVSVPASTFVTDITATANNQAVVGVGATGASKISAFNGGAAAFTVQDGVLSLDYTAATLTYGNATTSTLATISVNNYSATKNSAMTLG